MRAIFPTLVTLRVVVPALLSFLPIQIAAQQSEPKPLATLTAGLGQVVGGYGLSVEYHMAGSHLSALGGLGYWDASSPCSGTFSGAGAVRGFLGGRRHRGFLEVSYSLLEVECAFEGGDIVERKYGPGLSAGYRYTSSGGFTFTVGAGVGDIPDTSARQLLVLLGLGYTWLQ